MPKSLSEIILHGDELAKFFEDFDLDKAIEIDINEYRIRRAARQKAGCEKQIIDEVSAARKAGLSWKCIGEALGTSTQAAHKRYGALIDS